MWIVSRFLPPLMVGVGVGVGGCFFGTFGQYGLGRRPCNDLRVGSKHTVKHSNWRVPSAGVPGVGWGEPFLLYVWYGGMCHCHFSFPASHTGFLLHSLSCLSINHYLAKVLNIRLFNKHSQSLTGFHCWLCVGPQWFFFLLQCRQLSLKGYMKV